MLTYLQYFNAMNRCEKVIHDFEVFWKPLKWFFKFFWGSLKLIDN